MIYALGLIFAILIILISWDDFVWDLFYLLGKLFGKIKSNHVVKLEEVEGVVPKMMAVIIAAYREEDVIEEVIENLLKSTQYPMSMFHIFVGVYPNDPATTSIIHRLEEKYTNVHAVIHVLEGPSSKADNINNVIENIKLYEEERKIEFKFFVIHDSEDVVHPYEFLFENYLFEDHQVIQMPVFPLIPKPKFGNIFKNMVTSTYVDEFAENHYRMMPIRSAFHAFVPSAGTGFAIRRDVIDSYPDSNIFPVGSLTEDYKLSLQFKEKGFNLYYPLERVSKLNYEDKEVKEFIATRSMFPKTYKAAVRQKARWIHGITMQTFNLKDILLNKHLSIITRYSFYKDWKAKFGNLLILPAYLIFTYFIASYFFDIPIMYPKTSPSWYIMVVLTILMIQRQLLRFRAVRKVYGIRSASLAVLFPPLMPIRMILGNIINFHATLRAWRHHLFGEKTVRRVEKKEVPWVKTDHEFLEERVLRRFHRLLEDKLLDRVLLSSNEIVKYRTQAYKEHKLLREVLLEEQVLAEEDLVQAFCQVENTQYYSGPLGNFIHDENLQYFDLDLLKEAQVVPLFVFKDTIIFLGLIDSDWSKIDQLYADKTVRKALTFKKQLTLYLEGETFNQDIQRKLSVITECLANDKILARQAMIAMRYSNNLEDISDLFSEMGLLQCDRNVMLM